MGRRPKVDEPEVKKVAPKNNVKIIDMTDYLKMANEESKTNPDTRPYLRAIEMIYQQFDVLDKLEIKGINYFIVRE